MKISDEFKVGVFASLAITLLIIGFSFMKGKDLLGSNNVFYAKYNNIDGINNSNPVLYYGVQVGKVDNIALEYNNEKLEITLSISVSPEVKIPKGSIARIISSDIMGSKAVQIIPNMENKDGFAQSGDYLIGETELSLTAEVGKIVGPLKANAEKLLADLANVIEKVNHMLDEESQNDIKQSLANFRATSDEINKIMASSSGDIKSAIKDFKETSSKINGSTDDLTHTISNLSELSDSLSQAPIKATVEKVVKTVDDLNKILGKINDGEGTISKLINDPKLYNDFSKAANSLDSLLDDFQKHPKHYLAPLGKKNRKNWAE